MGARHPSYSLQCCLLDIWLVVFPLCGTWDYFAPVIKQPCFPILTLNLLSRYTPPHLLSRVLWTCMLLISILDVILGCLDVRLICLDKTNVVCYISILTLIFYDSVWEAVQVHNLTLFYDHDWTFWLGMLILKSP